MPKSKIASNRTVKLRKSLNPMREKLKNLAIMANQRVNELRSAGVDSKALFEAEKTQRKVHRETGEVFTSNVKSTRELNREMARIQAFMTDYTSLVEGAKMFTGELTHELYFGGQYRADGGYGANPEFVSKEKAEQVFEIYHKVLERGGGWERVIGYIKAMHPSFTEYGSEQLINAIYDMTEQISVEDMRADVGRRDLEEEDLTEYYVMKAYDLVEEMIQNYERISELQKYGEDYGYLEKDEEREARMKLWQWKVQREEMKRK